MGKVIDFLKRIPNIYYNWKERNLRLSEFLESSKNNANKLNHIDQTLTNLKTDLGVVKEHVDSLEQQVTQINGRLETIGVGTRMELFDTLHHWRITLVIKKKWASPAEKREVEQIFRIYHDKLKGNGQGERYYNEIMGLPESEEELHSKE